jgi:hypothetical protein
MIFLKMIVKFLKLIVLVHTPIILNVYRPCKQILDHRKYVRIVGASIGLYDPSEEGLLLRLRLLLLLHQVEAGVVQRVLEVAPLPLVVEVPLPHNSKQKFGNSWDWV